MSEYCCIMYWPLNSPKLPIYYGFISRHLNDIHPLNREYWIGVWMCACYQLLSVTVFNSCIYVVYIYLSMYLTTCACYAYTCVCHTHVKCVFCCCCCCCCFYWHWKIEKDELSYFTVPFYIYQWIRYKYINGMRWITISRISTIL